MSSVFARQQESVKKLIKKNGQRVVLRKITRVSAPGGKPWEQHEDETVYTDYAVDVVFFPFDGGSAEYKTEAWSKLLKDVTSSLTKAYLLTLDVSPSVSDVITTSTGKVYQLISVDVLAPNLVEPILYTLVLKE